MAEQKGPQGKGSFIGSQDRPDVKLNLDEPITNLRVRDLVALLGAGVIAKSVIADAHPDVAPDG
jgi:hypothetical protein